MITEDYVSFETAKLLKEKGFDCGCACINHPQCGMSLIGHMINNTDLQLTREFELCIDKENLFTIPTIQMAMKWLRKEHNLHIITIPYAPMDRHPYHPGEADVVYIAQLFKGIIPIDEIGRSIIKLTNEEACEAAIKYCLKNLI